LEIKAKTMTTTDPLTGENFVPHRTNQKFVSRKNQIAFNNRKARQKRRAEIPYDSKLKHNRKVLKQILVNEKETIRSRDFLKGAGFDFRFFHSTSAKDDSVIYYIYEFNVEMLPNGTYHIKRRKTNG